MSDSVVRILRPVLITGFVLLVAMAASAQDGTISLTVHQSYGVPLAGAKVTVDGNPAGTTDAAGELSSRVPVGTHQLVISHPEFRPLSKTVHVGAKHARELSARLQPLGSGSERLFGSRPFAHAVAVGFSSESHRDLEFKRGERTSATVTGPATITFVDDVDPATENQSFKNSLSLSAETVELTLRLRSSGGVNLSMAHDAAIGAGARIDRLDFLAKEERAGGMSSSVGTRRIRPFLTAIVGKGDAEFKREARDATNVPFAVSAYKDTVDVYGGALGGFYVPCEDCPWHFGMTLRYLKAQEGRGDRKPQTPALTGTTVSSDFATFDYKSSQVSAIIGYGMPRAVPYAGLVWATTRSNFSSVTRVEHPSASPGEPDATIDGLNGRFEDTSVEGLVGVMFRFGHTRFLGRIEATVGSDNDSVSTGLTYAFKPRQWSR
jgi:hypothetical protein